MKQVLKFTHFLDAGTGNTSVHECQINISVSHNKTITNIALENVADFTCNEITAKRNEVNEIKITFMKQFYIILSQRTQRRLCLSVRLFACMFYLRNHRTD